MRKNRHRRQSIWKRRKNRNIMPKKKSDGAAHSTVAPSSASISSSAISPALDTSEPRRSVGESSAGGNRRPARDDRPTPTFLMPLDPDEFLVRPRRCRPSKPIGTSESPYRGGHFRLQRATRAHILCGLVSSPRAETSRKRAGNLPRNPRRRDWMEAESARPSGSGRKRSTGTSGARPPTNGRTRPGGIHLTDPSTRRAEARREARPEIHWSRGHFDGRLHPHT